MPLVNPSSGLSAPVANASLATMPASTLKGNITAAVDVPTDVIEGDARTMLKLIISTSQVVYLFGHSYFNTAVATYDQTGRMDAMLRSALHTEAINWFNLAVNASRASMDNSAQNGGWVSVFNGFQRRGTKTTKNVWPYTSGGGVTFFQWGINDLSNWGNTTQLRAAFIHAMRCCISRARSSVVLDPTDASCAYGAGFTAITTAADFSTMGTVRRATTTVNATITITIPADYSGESICIAFIANAGVVGGTVTFSGTAGMTGTISTSNIQPAANATTCPVLKRATVAVTNATKTIICTVSAIDAGGRVDFDSWWLESKTPPPVIVCNIARPTSTQQAAMATWVALEPTEAGRDASVGAWNADLTTLKAEFDGMVQISDIDTTLNKDPTLFSPGSPLHPNENGYAKMTDTTLVAINALSPAGGLGNAACFYPGVSSRSGIMTGFNPGNYYTTPGAKISAAAYTCVAGDMFAIPFQITDAGVRYSNVSIEVTNAPTTGSSFRVGIYSNVIQEPRIAYPGLRASSTENSPITIATLAGIKTVLMGVELDTGLYWLVLKMSTVVATAPALRQIDGPCPYMPFLPTSGVTGGAVISPVGYKWTGLGSSALPSVMPSGGVLFNSAPMITLLAAQPN